MDGTMTQPSTDKPLKIFFSVGEPSGDLHGANLIRALRSERPDVECIGFGGPKMQAAGCRLHVDLTALAVMWLLRVLLNLHVFVRLLRDAKRIFRDQRPDAVVLIDYPGFNWHIARAAKEAGIPVFYYSPPQIWAWASWRVKKMRRFVDHVLCGLPFEEAWFRKHGCNATFVGHPYFDEVQHCQLDAAFLAQQRAKPGRLVTILPGSRTQEVTHNLHWFLKASLLIKAQTPDVRFAIASFKPHQAEIARRQLGEVGLEAEVHVGRTPELIHLAECAMACSGSVSLELLYHTKPTVVLYWISRLAFAVQRWFRKVKYITLVNLLTADELFPKDLTPFDPQQPGAERVLFPEYLTCEDKSPQIAAHVVEWLNNPAKHAARIAELAQLKQQVCHGGASRVAAQYIVKAITPVGHPIPAPHFASQPADGVATKTSRATT
jgi:lipid-A-disaccharide synthase